jgi:hypothetical protein
MISWEDILLMVVSPQPVAARGVCRGGTGLARFAPRVGFQFCAQYYPICGKLSKGRLLIDEIVGERVLLFQQRGFTSFVERLFPVYLLPQDVYMTIQAFF